MRIGMLFLLAAMCGCESTPPGIDKPDPLTQETLSLGSVLIPRPTLPKAIPAGVNPKPEEQSYVHFPIVVILRTPDGKEEPIPSKRTPKSLMTRVEVQFHGVEGTIGERIDVIAEADC